MKLFIACLVLLLALSPALAWAGDGANGNGADNNGNGNAGSHGSGNNGNGSEQGQDGNAGGGPGSGRAAPDQNQALEAIGAGALPLSDIADRAVAQWGGRVIDAKLIERDGALIYRLTLLSDQGVSRRVLYNAKTGVPLKGQ